MSTASAGQQKPQDARRTDGPAPGAEQGQRAKPQAPGAATVSTTDPVANSGSERQARLNEHPERSVTLETNPAESAAPSGPVGDPCDVVESGAAPPAGRGDERRPQNDDVHGEEARERVEKSSSKKHGEHKKRQHEGNRAKQEGGSEERDEHNRDRHERDRHDRDHHDHNHRPRKKKKKDKHHDRAAPAPASPGWKTLLMTGVLAIVCGVAGAWGYSYFTGDSSKAGDDKSQKSGGKSGGEKSGGKGSSGKGKSGAGSSDTGDESASPRQIPSFTSAEDADTLKKQIKHLDDRIDRLAQRIDRVTTPKEETPPVLRTLQIQMSDLAKEVDEVANLPSQVHQLEQRLASVAEQMKTIRSRRVSDTASFDAGEPSDDKGASLVGNAPLGDSRDDRSTLPAAGSTPPAPIDDDTGVADATLDLAIGLFQEAQYTQARQVLVRLQRSRPNDARVWYYSALTNGLTTGVWDGETKMLLDKAVKRERAGTPSRAQVDAALAGLTAEQGKSWLARRRQQVAKSKSRRNY